MVKKKKTHALKIIIVALSVLIILLLVKLFFFGTPLEGEHSYLCKPGLFCYGDSIAYRNLDCSFFVNTEEKAQGLCVMGKFSPTHPMVARIAWEQNVPTMIIRDYDGDIFKWDYYQSGNNAPQKFEDKPLLASPPEYPLTGEQSGLKIIYEFP